MRTATAIAHPNIALVKYWGKRNRGLNLPAVPSLSLTLDTFRTRTQVLWGTDADAVHFAGSPAPAKFAEKVLAFLDFVSPNRPPCLVLTENNFPVGAGLASSASGFAALTLAAVEASGRNEERKSLSVMARRGSGSACRSLYGGFVEWRLGSRPDGSDSHAIPVANEDYWAVCMVVAVVTDAAKATGSTEGMERSRQTSPYYQTWVDTAPADLEIARQAVFDRDLEALGTVTEQSTMKMHATMTTSTPPLLYWLPSTVALMHEVQALRARGIGAWATMDAGPQVKVLCLASDAAKVTEALKPHARRIHVLHPGPAAFVEEPEE